MSGLPANRNVWSAVVLQAKNEDGGIGLRECIRPLLEKRSPGLNGMRCALVLFSFAALVGIFRLQVSGAPGSTVVPSHVFASKPGRDLKTQISRRWTADVGIASAISKPGACASVMCSPSERGWLW